MRIIKPVEFDPSDGNFSRGSTGTYFDKDGVLRTAAVDEPRWNYTFEDGEWVGPELLVEGQSTNLLTYSSDFANAAWSKAAGAWALVADARFGVVGLFTEDSTTGSRVTGQSISLTAGKTYTHSEILKAVGRQNVRIQIFNNAGSVSVDFDLSAGTFGGSGGSIASLGNGWFRCSVTLTAAVTGSHVVRFYPIEGTSATYTGDGRQCFLNAGAQLEAGSSPSSYIPTTTAQATRAADIPGRIVTNVPEDDAPVWVAGTYTQGTKRIQNHRVYEVLAESTTDAPADGVAKAVPTWLNLGATNRWRMFDDKVGSLTEQTGSIAVELQPGAVINSVALFNLLGRSATVTLTDPSEGVVYQRTVSLVDAGVSNWYEWFFSPIGRQTDFVLLDLPAYGTATLSVTIDNASDTAAVGHLVMGRQAELGVAVYGSGVGITDYSRKETDTFGNSVVVERSFSKRAEFDVVVETPQIGRVQRMLASLRAQPVVWIGAEGYESTFLFGYYRDFQISISGPSVSDASITIEGLT